MYRADFVQCRHYLGKTQTELARLLGVSTKAVQSFEQGWRRIPAHTERQLLLLTYLKRRPLARTQPCWEQKHCAPEVREKCITWEVQAGDLCWFISGTMCEAEFQGSWAAKIERCRQCEVFLSTLLSPVEPGCETPC